MRVQVGEEEGEEGEFVDCGGDHPARPDVPVAQACAQVGESAVGEGLLYRW